MSAGNEENLVWPPRAEDLRRLYVEKHLSAAKIAARYGLKYDSPKTAESTVLYHLKRNGISRRDKAEHIRKVTEEMVDGWVKRYGAGESLKQLAGNEFSPVTVFFHLRKRGITLRDKVEAQIKAVTKHKRLQFDGSGSQRDYFLGFAWGDCAIERHGRGVRVKTGSTHPEFVALFKALFSRYGNLRSYPTAARIVPAELNMEIDLDGSFEFLLKKKVFGSVPSLENRDAILNFAAGFFDAEGSIYFHINGFEAQISNSDERLMRVIHAALEQLGYRPKLYHTIDHHPSVGHKLESHMWNLKIQRHQEVKRLLSELPLRHKEKVTKASIAIAYMNGRVVMDSSGYPAGWLDYTETIERNTKDFVKELVLKLKERESFAPNVAEAPKVEWASW